VKAKSSPERTSDMARTNNVPTRAAAQERRRKGAAERQAIYDALPQSVKDERNPRKAKPVEVK
jgi:hypothetical protein